MKKSFKYGINTLLTILLTLGIAIFAILISSSFHKRFDITKEKKYTLSPQTIKILKNLDKEVKVLVFYKGVFYQRQAENLLDQYKNQSKNFKIETLETNKNPLKARNFNLTSPNSLVVICKDRKEVLKQINEEEITNALIKVIQKGRKTICFTEGHGERNINKKDFQGIFQAADSLRKESYQVINTNLIKDNNLSRNCNVLVIAGPKADFFEVEIEKIKKYIGKGGAVLFLFELSSKTPNLIKLLEEKGIKVNNNIIIDQLSYRLTRKYLFASVGKYSNHSITKGFNILSIFPLSRTLTIIANSPAKISWEAIASTTSLSWSRPAKYIANGIKRKDLKFNKLTDTRGPLVVGAAAKLPLIIKNNNKVLTKRKDSRLTVFSDTEFITNPLFVTPKFGNKNLFLNTISWLAEQENLISIRPKKAGFTPLNLNVKEKRFIFLLSMILLPLLVIVIGTTVMLYKNS